MEGRGSIQTSARVRFMRLENFSWFSHILGLSERKATLFESTTGMCEVSVRYLVCAGDCPTSQAHVMWGPPYVASHVAQTGVSKMVTINLKISQWTTYFPSLSSSCLATAAFAFHAS